MSYEIGRRCANGALGNRLINSSNVRVLVSKWLAKLIALFNIGSNFFGMCVNALSHECFVLGP